MKNQLLAVLGVSLLMFSACDKEEVKEEPAEVKTATFSAAFSYNAEHNTFFSFKTGGTVAATDSASDNWDFAVKLERFIVNSHASGPGNVEAQILSQAFNEVTIAPENGYAHDTTSIKLAIKGPNWYTYNPATHSFAPTAGKTFIFRTADNKYAKMEIVQAIPTNDAGDPVTPPTLPTKIKYNIRFAYQASGSTKF